MKDKSAELYQLRSTYFQAFLSKLSLKESVLKVHLFLENRQDEYSENVILRCHTINYIETILFLDLGTYKFTILRSFPIWNQITNNACSFRLRMSAKIMYDVEMNSPISALSDSLHRKMTFSQSQLRMKKLPFILS